jgi:hypothetical protein
MKRKLISICLLLIICINAAGADGPPQAVISNGVISVKLYLPDAEKGYYQASRFDWSGLIAGVVYENHSYFGKWFDIYSPKIHDAVSGPVESFTPIGYNDAAAGGTFLEIGVGVLRKPDEQKYTFSKPYNIVNGGKWTVKTKKDRIIFTHELHDSAGYAYRYTKTIRLVKDSAQLVLEHTLKNIGRKTIETDVYDHNFPLIDGEPTGPAMRFIFPFQVTAQGRGWGILAQTDGNEIRFLRTFDSHEQLYSPGLQGFGNTPKDYDFNIRNERTGAGMEITGDQPLEKLVYWACSTTACPEPYIKIKALPHKETKWRIKYRFYTFKPDYINGH